MGVPGHSPDTPSLPDATALRSPALPDPANYPPSFPQSPKHSPILMEARRHATEQDMLTGSEQIVNASEYYSEDFPSCRDTFEPSTHGTDAYYGADHRETELTYDSRGALCYSAPPSSPVLGLNDSLEDMECDDVSYRDTHSCGAFSEDMELWLPPPADDSHFSADDYVSSKSSFSQAAQSKPERNWRQSFQSLSHLVRSDPSGLTPAIEHNKSTTAYEPPQSNPTMYESTASMARNPLENNPQTTVAGFAFNPTFPSGHNEDAPTSFLKNSTSSSHIWGTGVASSISTSIGVPGLYQSINGAAGDHVSMAITGPQQIAPTASYSSDTIPSSSTSMISSSHLIPRSTKAISSLVVRKPRLATEHKPVKALDLGIESERERNVRLRSNDRILASAQSTNSSLLQGSVWMRRDSKGGEDFDKGANGEIVRSKYFPASSSSIPSTNGGIKAMSSSKAGVGAAGSVWGRTLGANPSTDTALSGWRGGLGSSWGGTSSRVADLRLSSDKKEHYH